MWLNVLRNSCTVPYLFLFTTDNKQVQLVTYVNRSHIRVLFPVGGFNSHLLGIYSYAACRFVAGVGQQGLFNCAFSLAIELVPDNAAA